MKTIFFFAVGATIVSGAGSGYAQTGSAAGSASGMTVTYTFALGRTAPPAAPANLRIVGQTGSDLVLAWDASAAGQGRTIAGYELLRNGVAVAQPSGLTATVELDATGRLLEFFSVRARDSSGAWSAPGNEVLAPRLSSDLPFATAMRIETKRVGAYRSERGWRAIDGSNELRYQRAEYTVKESERYVEPNGIAHSYTSTMTARMEYGDNSPERSISVSGVCDFRNFPAGGDYGTNGYSGFTGIVPWMQEWSPYYNQFFARLTGVSGPGHVSLDDLFIVSQNAESATYAFRVVENIDTPSYQKTKSYELTLSVPYGGADIISGTNRDYALALDHLGQLAWGESVMISYGTAVDESLFDVIAERGYDDAETEAFEQSLQAGIYRIETETPGRQRLKWAEVFYPYDGERPSVLAVREEIVDPEVSGPFSGEYRVEAPTTPGYVVILPVGLGIEVLPPAASPGNDGARLFVRDGLFVGQAAEVVVSLPYASEEGSGELFTLRASATGDGDPVRLLAVDPEIERAQGLAAAIAQGQPITAATNLLDEPYAGIAEWGGWKLLAVGVKAGTAVVTFDVEGESAARSSVVLTVYPMPALAVDANRDGRIALPHEDASDATSAARPFRFWINDDDDSGDISDTGPSLIGNPDEPGRRTGFWEFDGRTPDFYRTGVDGRSDLLDFFPVFLGVGEMTAVLSPSDADIKYKLQQDDSALNFVYTDLERVKYADYLRHSRERPAYGPPGGKRWRMKRRRGRLAPREQRSTPHFSRG